MSIEFVIDNIIKREGGYTVDHAGPTNLGITIPAYMDFTKREVTEDTIKNLTKYDAICFYKWLLKKHNLDQIGNWNLMDLLFDCITNHGANKSIKWAQRYARVTQDGIIGPITIGAINSNVNPVYYGILKSRIKLYVFLSITNPKKYSKFLKGWINRSCQFIKEV